MSTVRPPGGPALPPRIVGGAGEEDDFPELRGFAPRSRDVRPLAEVVRPVDLRVTRSAPDLTDAQFAIFMKLANAQIPAPAVDPYEGRSLLFRVSGPLWAGRLGFKMKGALGCEACRESCLHIVPRAPLRSYGAVRQRHLELAPGLRAGVASSPPKAYYCLRQEAADNEFDVQCALARAGLGYKGLLSLALFEHGRPLLDLHDQPLGVVFSEFGGPFFPLAEYVQFALLWDWEEDDLAIILPAGRGPLAGSIRPMNEYVDITLDMAARIGAARRRAHFDARVAQHTGHCGNFLLDEQGGRLFLTDTDSALCLDARSGDWHGPLVLRDLASDLLHLSEEFAVRLYTPPFLQRLEAGRYPLFHQYLSGYFDGVCAPAAIRQTADFMTNLWCQFFKRYEAELQDLSHQTTRAFSQGITLEALAKAKPLRSEWFRYFKSLYPMFVGLPYTLAKTKGMARAGFPLPDVHPKVVADRIIALGSALFG